MSRLTLPLVLLLAAPALAAGPDARTITDRMRVALEPRHASTRKLALTVSSELGGSTESIAGEARKAFPGGSRVLTVVLAPAGVRGVAILAEEHGHDPVRRWLYAPAVRRVRELVTSDVHQSFLNSDFTYADLGFTREGRSDRLAGTEKRDTGTVYRIETTPRDAWYYSRIVTWVDGGSWLPVRREFYDPAGLRWKVETWSDVAKIDDVPVPLTVRMEDVRQSGFSEIRVSDVLWDRDLPDDLFEPRNLPQAVSATVWGTPSP
jgi:hypothetical protein